MMDRASERTRSPAYQALRASARRLLRFIEMEIERQGGAAVSIYSDQFAVVGSIRVVRPGLPELQELGFIDWQRFPKRQPDQPLGSMAQYRDRRAGYEYQRRRSRAARVAVATGIGRRVIDLLDRLIRFEYAASVRRSEHTSRRACKAAPRPCARLVQPIGASDRARYG
jgi:hypothetical protein